MKIKIVSFILWLCSPFIRLWDRPYSIRYIEDPVDSPRNKTLYIVGSVEEPWQVELVCPCGCKDKIVLPVNDSTSPRWTLTLEKKRIPTLHPSVWRSKGCKSHFFLKKGKIDWCRKTGNLGP